MNDSQQLPPVAPPVRRGSGEVAELAALLRSKVPLILVESHEEPRLLKMLQQACNLENRPLFCWSIVDGIKKYGANDAVYNTNNLIDALRHIDKSAVSGVYALCDAHPGVKDPVNARLIRQIALEQYQAARVLVFVSPTLEDMPEELLRLAAHFAPRLPTRDEIRAILAEEAQLWLSQSGEKPRANRAVVEQFILQLMGLEQEDVRRLVRQALRADGEISADDLRRVLATKHAALGGAGVLGLEAPRATFAQVGGMERLKQWIALRRGPFIESAGDGELDRPRGVILIGVQGGGKSLAARAVAGEWNVPLMRLDFGALYNKFFGETERNLRLALATAEGMAPCVLWIDEMEKGVASSDGEGDGGLSRRVLGGFLTWLAERARPVFIVATANEIDSLPPELVRKGRFDEIFFVDFPRAPAREQIFSIHFKQRGLDPAQFDLASLARLAHDFSGAEIEQAIVAARFAAKARNTSVTSQDVEIELARTRPLSVVMAERIAALRNWARDRAVFVDDVGDDEANDPASGAA